MINFNDNKVETKEHLVEESVLQPLLKTIGITDKEDTVKVHLEEHLSELNGVIDNLSADEKEWLIYYYAKSE